ncbi:class I adenylate-forming enzyme family protein [Aquipuribacter hungaricus]|uniref:Class I adenylate-forming enzyme family protein n=2 Tax=Aquipuribacter hungaricus TaxID=545624 RepID=A0ABV7WIC1_9MICO
MDVPDVPLRPFARLLADSAARHGGRPALVDPVLGAEVTHAGLRDLVEEAATRLLAQVAPGERVAVLARNGLEQAVAALACSRAGLVHVGLPAGDPPERLAAVLRSAAPRLLLVQPGLDGTAAATLGASSSGADPAVLPTGHVLLAEGRTRSGAGAPVRRARALPPLPEDAAAVHSLVATSGSTGAPKLVRLTGAMVDHAARAYGSLLGLGPDDRTPVHLPMWWVSGHVTQLASALASGGSVVTMPAWSPADLVAVVRRHGATWLDLVPTLWHGLLREDGFSAASLPSLRAAVFGGAPAAPEVLAEVRRRVPGVALLDAYAMSEVPSPLTCLTARDAAVHPTSVGRALPGVHVEVVDEQGRALPTGATGAVAVRSPALTPGYDGGARLAVDDRGRFRTGDVGVLDDEGFLVLTGRAADRMIRGGVTIHPAEVERALLASGLVAAAVVVPVPARLHGDDVGAVVVPTLGAPSTPRQGVAGPDVAALRAAVRARVGAHAVPVRVVVVDELPRTPNGKPDREAVRRLLA